jgi:hypothetical protein
MRKTYKYWSENIKGREHLEDRCAGKIKLLNWILMKQNGSLLESSESGQEPVTGSSEHGDETSGSIKGKVVLLFN